VTHKPATTRVNVSWRRDGEGEVGWTVWWERRPRVRKRVWLYMTDKLIYVEVEYANGLVLMLLVELGMYPDIIFEGAGWCACFVPVLGKAHLSCCHFFILSPPTEYIRLKLKVLPARNVVSAISILLILCCFT